VSSPWRTLLQAPTTALRGWQVVLLLLGMTVAIGLGGAAAPTTAALPIAAALMLGALVLALTNLWYGIVVTLVAVMLLPTPFSVNVGGATLTVGRLVLFMLLVGWLVQHGRREAPVDRRPTPLDRFLWIIVAAMLLAAIVNVPRLDSAELLAMLRKVSLFVVDFFLLFGVTTVALGTKERAVRFVRIITGVIAVIGVFGVVERFTGRNVFEFLDPVLPAGLNRTIALLADASTLQRGAINRVHSTIEHPLALAVLLLMGLPLAASFALAATTRKQRALWSASAFVMGLALLFTASRGAYLILVPMFFTVLATAPDRRARRAIVVAAIAFGTVGAIDHDVRTTMGVYLGNLATGGRPGASIENRVDAFGATSKLLEDRPLLGFGPGTFSAEQLRQNELISDEVKAPVLDNAYLGFAAETGAIGMAALAGMLFAAWLLTFRLWRSGTTRDDKLLAGALLAAVVAWILFAFVADVYVFNAPPRVFFALLGAVAVLRMNTGIRPEPAGTAPR
jgi:hypothetical protein